MNQRRNIAWVDWLRASAMISIMLCHLAEQAPSDFGPMIAQFLNLGVELFFIISGYLLGRRPIQTNYATWLRHRIFKLMPSYGLFLILLAAVHFALHLRQTITSWIVSFLCLQGLGGYLIGAEDLWFLTVLLLCYMITPLLDLLRKRVSQPAGLITLLLVSSGLQVCATFLIGAQAGRYWFLVDLYILAYLLGTIHFECTNKKGIIIAVVLEVCAIALRLLGRHVADGTVLYNIFIVGLTHACLAICILTIYQYIFRQPVPRMIRFLDSISYEVYLVHYMFIAGPVSLMKLTSSFWVNSLLAMGVSMISATLLHFLSDFLITRIRKRN